MEQDPNSPVGANARPNAQPDVPAAAARPPERQRDAVAPTIRPVTVWRGGLPESIRTAAGRPAAANSTGGSEQAQIAPSAGKGFDRFWADTCRYWASSPDSLLKR